MAQEFIPPLLAPDLQRKKFELERAAQMGRALMDQGSQMPQGQMVSGHYVAPSWTQYLAQGLKSYLGGKAMNSIPDRLAGLQKAQQQHTQSLFMPQQDQGKMIGQVLAAGAAGGSVGPTNQNAAQLGQALSGKPIMPLLFPNDPQRSMMAYEAMGPGAYLKLAAQQGAPTNEQKNLAFLPEPQRNALIAAPFLNDAGKDGVQNMMGPDGRVQALAVPGYGDIQAQNAGAVAAAQAGAQAPYRFVDVPDGQGGTIKMREDQASAALGDAQSGTATPDQSAISGYPAGNPQQGALGTKPADRVIEARTELPKVVNQAQQMINSIDGVLSHPGLEAGTGLSSFLPSVTDDARDFDVRAAQLKGQAFLQAFESLKGGGQITEVEGKAATEAIGRLSQAQSKESYKESLKELRGILETAISRAYEKAGLAMPESTQSDQVSPGLPPPGTVDGGWRFNGGDPAAPSSWSKVGG